MLCITCLRMGAAYFDTNYKVGKEYAALQSRGTAASRSLYATYPLIRSQASNLSGTLTWEAKRLYDHTGTPLNTIDKQVQLANLGLAGNRQDAFAGGGISSFDLSLVSGRLSMDANSLATDAASALSHGSFLRLGYNLSRLQRITDTDTLSLALSGQQASKNLNSSEKFSLGGSSGVRAFPQSEASGDQGLLGNLELRHSFRDNLQGVMFYDAGKVTINHNPYIQTSANSRTLSGAGLGMNAAYFGVQIKAYAAWRLSGGVPLSEPATLNRNPRVWVQTGKQF